MRIYTRTGDKGTTGLFGGKRVAKNTPRIEAVGSIDEPNSAIGVTIAFLSSRAKRGDPVEIASPLRGLAMTIEKDLIKIQQDLFEIGAALASPSLRLKFKNSHKNSSEFSGQAKLQKRVEEFEKLIDKLTVKLPELRNFILPGGSKAGAMLHLARSVSRRAERSVVALSRKEKIDNEILIYMNRLSDVLFTMARFVNMKMKIPEKQWKGFKNHTPGV